MRNFFSWRGLWITFDFDGDPFRADVIDKAEFALACAQHGGVSEDCIATLMLWEYDLAEEVRMRCEAVKP